MRSELKKHVEILPHNLPPHSHHAGSILRLTFSSILGGGKLSQNETASVSLVSNYMLSTWYVYLQGIPVMTSVNLYDSAMLHSSAQFLIAYLGSHTPMGEVVVRCGVMLNLMIEQDTGK